MRKWGIKSKPYKILTIDYFRQSVHECLYFLFKKKSHHMLAMIIWIFWSRFSFMKFSMANFHFKTNKKKILHVQQHNTFHHVQVIAQQLLKTGKIARIMSLQSV